MHKRKQKRETTFAKTRREIMKMRWSKIRKYYIVERAHHKIT
jgi:hypothetical protein